MRLIGRGIRAGLGVAALGLLVPWCANGLAHFVLSRTALPRDFRFLLAGASLGIAACAWFYRGGILAVLHHELCHLLACVMLGVPVKSLTATEREGGFVCHDAVGPLRTSILRLAPYTFPVILFPLLLARYVVPHGLARAILSAACAFAFVLHLWTVVMNTRGGMRGTGTDLAAEGKLFSLGAISATLVGVCRVALESLCR